jgi:hypothetical protein
MKEFPFFEVIFRQISLMDDYKSKTIARRLVKMQGPFFAYVAFGTESYLKLSTLSTWNFNWPSIGLNADR